MRYRNLTELAYKCHWALQTLACKAESTAKEDPDANYFTFSDAAVNATCENIMRHMEIFGLKNKL